MHKAFDVQHIGTDRDHEYTKEALKRYSLLQQEGSCEDGKDRRKTQIRNTKGQGGYSDRTEIYIIGKDLKGKQETHEGD